MAHVKIYSTRICPYCVRAKQLLQSKGAEYQEVFVDSDMALMKEMMELSGRRSVPQIFIGEQSIGGFDDLNALNQKGELDALLDA
ncbi:MAG: glutaredoxin 3 [Candidatus Polarisedimenticolaceae bacterium]|nr:glutaredoxin 3 [Candidatus Polarisedimenticolaceae bacterium]